MTEKDTDKAIPEDDHDTEWVYLRPADGPLLDQRGFVICVLVAVIAVSAWILTGILNT